MACIFIYIDVLLSVDCMTRVKIQCVYHNRKSHAVEYIG